MNNRPRPIPSGHNRVLIVVAMASMDPAYLAESIQDQQRVGTIVVPVLAIFALAARLLLRKLNGIGLGLDDYLLVVGLVRMTRDAIR